MDTAKFAGAELPSRAVHDFLSASGAAAMIKHAPDNVVAFITKEVRQ
jgi:hypothetical protein